MIYYDFDGVFISDCSYGNPHSGEEFLNLRRDFPQPIFNPRGDFGIITGRNRTDYHHTMDFIDKWFATPPKIVHHECPDFRLGREYKEKVINKHNIKVFVESCPSQAAYLTKHCPSCKIVLFRELINEALSRL